MANLKQRFTALESSGLVPGPLSNLIQLRMGAHEGKQVDDDLVEGLERGVEVLYDRKPEAMIAALDLVRREYPELYALHDRWFERLRVRVPQPPEKVVPQEDPAVPMGVLVLLLALIAAGAAYAFVPGARELVDGLLARLKPS